MNIIIDGTGKNNVARFLPGIRELTYPKSFTLKLRDFSTDVAELVPHGPLAWSGEGLPPVGTVCEWHNHEQVRIITHTEQGVGNTLAVGQVGDRGSLVFATENSGSFHPIRTPEHIAADERDLARTEVLNAMTADGRTEGENEENWQFRMQIVGEMLDMGYRKQVSE